MPFITETSAWLQKHWPDGVTFRYYTVSDMEKAVQNREVDIVLTEAGGAAMLRRDGARPMLTTVSRRHPNPERSQGSVVLRAKRPRGSRRPGRTCSTRSSPLRRFTTSRAFRPPSAKFFIAATIP